MRQLNCKWCGRYGASKYDAIDLDNPLGPKVEITLCRSCKLTYGTEADYALMIAERKAGRNPKSLHIHDLTREYMQIVKAQYPNTDALAKQAAQHLDIFGGAYSPIPSWVYEIADEVLETVYN